MASTKKEYEDWKQISPEFCILHKLHAEDVSRQFGGLPRPVIMSWHDYDKYIHLNDLCAYDLLLCLLGGPGIRMGVKPFMVHLILFLAGIALCINKHPWWGALCFVITVLSML